MSAHGRARHPDRRDAGDRARAGETAPLLFTALFSEYWISRHQPVFSAARRWRSDEADRVAGRAHLQLFRLAVRKPDRDGLGGRLVLVVLVLMLNIAGQSLSKRYKQITKER